MFTIIEHGKTMNEMELIEAAREALQQLGLQTRVLKEPKRNAGGFRPDAVLRIGKAPAHIDFAAEVKRTVTPATLGATLGQLGHVTGKDKHPGLLVTEYVTPPTAEKLRALGQPFVDAAGNAYLTGPGLLVYVAGRKPARKPTQAGQAFTPAGLKVLFVLICEPELAGAPYRKIAAAANVALGRLPAVLGDLKREGHLIVLGRRRRLHATKRLLDQWAMGYAQQLRGKTLKAIYHAPNFKAWQDWKLDDGPVRWGGEPAANLLVHYLRPGILTLYAAKLPPRLMVGQKLTPAGPQGTDQPLELREPFWGPELHKGEYPATVPPALVYADLLATGDGRCMETAGMVYEQYLARLFPAK